MPRRPCSAPVIRCLTWVTLRFPPATRGGDPRPGRGRPCDPVLRGALAARPVPRREGGGALGREPFGHPCPSRHRSRLLRERACRTKPLATHETTLAPPQLGALARG